MKFATVPPSNINKLTREVNAGLASKLNPDDQFNGFVVIVTIDAGAEILIQNQLRDGRGNRIIPGEWAVIDAAGAPIGSVVRGDTPWTTTKLYLKNNTTYNGQFRVRFMERPKITGDESRVSLIAPAQPPPDPDLTPRSEVYVDTPGAGAAGYGTTNTKIRRFTGVRKNIGPDITYADSATLGASFTINAPGIYAIVYSDADTTATGGTAFGCGISVNSSVNTTNFSAISYAQGKRAAAIPVTGVTTSTLTASWTGRLEAGNVVRPHTGGSNNGVTNNEIFSICQLVKF